jgi:hypothetical protein
MHYEIFTYGDFDSILTVTMGHGKKTVVYNCC